MHLFVIFQNCNVLQKIRKERAIRGEIWTCHGTWKQDIMTMEAFISTQTK
jgi:hypothetical protein